MDKKPEAFISPIKIIREIWKKNQNAEKNIGLPRENSSTPKNSGCKTTST